MLCRSAERVSVGSRADVGWAASCGWTDSSTSPLVAFQPVPNGAVRRLDAEARTAIWRCGLLGDSGGHGLLFLTGRLGRLGLLDWARGGQELDVAHDVVVVAFGSLGLPLA